MAAVNTSPTPTRLFPSMGEIKKLTPDYGEQDYQLVNYLDTRLPKTWEIYFEPFFNGNFPDLVVLNPTVGMTIFVIKKWQPGEVVAEDELRIDLKTQKQVSSRSFYRQNSGKKQKVPNPITQVEHYRDNLVNLYCPFIGEEIEKRKQTLAAFKVALYFPNLTTQQAQELLQVGKKRCVVFGKDGMQADDLSEIVPDYQMGTSIAMKEDWADPIRSWLFPPIHPLDDRNPNKLTTKQEKIARPAAGKHMKVRGVIGSGKTLVIAHRAARLAAKGKKVLVVTFNITLWHYIKHYVDQYPERFDWKNLEFHHFHGFCRDYLLENEVLWPSGDDDGGSSLDHDVPMLVKENVKKGNNKKGRRYEAILIDEGQDFLPGWYEALCTFLTKNDEILFVCDEKQNIYGRKLDWLDSGEYPKLAGSWNELPECHRMPEAILAKVNSFARMFLPELGLEPVPAQLGLFDPGWVWLEARSYDDVQNKVWNCYQFLTRELHIPNQDIVILIPSHHEGWQLVECFKKNRIDVNHVFEDDEKSHHHKKSFWIHDPRLKITTIHSFKGWELSTVIMVTPTDKDAESSWQDFLVYTAMSRTRQNLIVINRMTRYRKFGEDWPKGWTNPIKIF